MKKVLFLALCVITLMSSVNAQSTKATFIKDFYFTYIPPCKISDARSVDLVCEIFVSSTEHGIPTKMGELVASTGPAGCNGDDRVDSAPFFYTADATRGLKLGDFPENGALYISYKIHESGSQAKIFEGKEVATTYNKSVISSTCIKTSYTITQE